MAMLLTVEDLPHIFVLILLIQTHQFLRSGIYWIFSEMSIEENMDGSVSLVKSCVLTSHIHSSISWRIVDSEHTVKACETLPVIGSVPLRHFRSRHQPTLFLLLKCGSNHAHIATSRVRLPGLPVSLSLELVS